MEFGLRTVTGPADEPVTLAEAKARLRITIDDEDSDLESLIREARALCEAGCQRAFVTQTFDMTLDEFPQGCGDRNAIAIPRPPLASVSWVKYYATDGTLATIDAADYYVSTASEPGRIAPVLGYWPATLDRPDAVQIRFVAGFGAPADVPPEVKAAILVTARALREDPSAPLPRAARAFLDTLETGMVR